MALYGYSQEMGYEIYPLQMADIRRGKGYWLYLENASRCEYACAPAPGEFTIPLDEGWTLWGYPFTEGQPWDDCRITDGVDTLDPASAEAAGWIQSTIFGYEGGYFLVPDQQLLVEP